MLTYPIEQRGTESLYEYLCGCIRRDIANGVLKPGERLPSKRSFAAHHGISVVTVENAYGQLQAEGYITSRPKSGFFVSAISGVPDTGKEKSDLVIRSDEEPPDDMIALSSAHTAAENFPFSIWARLMRDQLAGRSEALMTPPPPGGVMELREAIAGHLRDFRGISCRAEQIIVGAGTEYLYNLLVQLLGRDKIYGLENPGPGKLRSIYQAQGVRTVPLRMDEDGIVLSPDNLAVPDIIQISPSHHFPTGIVTPVSRRYGLLQWASQAPERYIIEDDYDSEFRLQGKPIPSLFSIDATERVIYLNTFTKSLASTIRISYMVLPRGMIERFYERLGFYSCTVPNFEQYTLAAFIRDGHFEAHINRMRVRYRRIRDLLLHGIGQSVLRGGVEVTEENSGLHFLLKLHTRADDETLKRLAAAQGLRLSFLSDYYSAEYGGMDSRYAHTAVISFSALPEDRVPRVVRALEAAFAGVTDITHPAGS